LTDNEMSRTTLSLANALLESQQCASLEEAIAVTDTIVEEILEENPHENGESFRQSCTTALQDYFALTREEATNLMRPRTVDDEDSANDNEEEYETESEEEEEYIGEGECELCERFLKLTKHHLIPKSTWARIETKLLRAAAAVDKHDPDHAKRILGHGLEHLHLNLNESTRSSIRHIMGKTCSICRPCHSAIHSTHDNMTLALNYNTVEKLLGDERIYKFCRWANKQKAGKHAR
jgi:hypothetical protein